MNKTIRSAKLFEAGNYPDKGICVSEEDLERLVKGFEEIPVKIEHTDTVFDNRIGRVTEVWQQGKELYGSIEFDSDLWELLDKIDARALSVALNPQLTALTEVSIVKAPRVADARVFCFSDALSISGSRELAEENHRLRQEIAGLKEQLGRLDFAAGQRAAAAEAEELVRSGHITPAGREAARDILLSGSESRQLFMRFIATQPTIAEAGELHPEKPEAHVFSESELRLLEGLGADPARVAAKIKEVK